MTTTIPLHTDSPIDGGANSPDLLHRADFSNRIADVINGMPLNSGFVFSIEGAWGTGKTSVLNLIEKRFEELDKKDKPIVCNFNPWMIGNVEDLAQSYLIQLASSIQLNHNSDVAARAARELVSYSTIFSALRLLPGAEPWASLVKSVLDVVGTTTEKVADLKKLNTEKRREAVVNALNALERRIVVFIDDLDRLPPKEVFEMVRLVKAVGDFPSVVYVLCFDPEYVGNALASNQIHQSQGYLDKVIQTRLSLPYIDKEDLLAILNKEYDLLPEDAKREHFSKVNERVSWLYQSGIRYLLETPRDIKRLFNRIRFVEPGCRREVNIADIIALETIALKAPSVYDHIRKNPAAYIGVQLGQMNSFKKPQEIVESLKDERSAALSVAPQHLQHHIHELLAILFPLVEVDNFNTPPESGGLICTQDRLAIALSTGLPSNEVSLSIVADFVTNPDGRASTLNQCFSEGKIKRFLDLLSDEVKVSPVVAIENLAETLGKALDTSMARKEEKATKGVFDFGLSQKVWWVIKNSLEKLEPEARTAAIRHIASQTDLISLSTLAISFLHAQHGGFQDDRKLPEEYRWVDAASMATLSQNWATAMASAIADRSVFTATKCGVVFFRLQRFHPDVLSSLVSSIVNNDEALDLFVMAIGPRGTDSINGRYAKFDIDTLERYGGAELFKSRAQARLSDSNVQGELRYIYTAIDGGKQIYLIDGSIAEN